MRRRDEDSRPAIDPELARVLVALRPQLEPEPASRIDERFVAAAARATPWSRRRRSLPRGGWTLTAAGGAIATAAVALVLALGGGGGSAPSPQPQQLLGASAPSTRAPAPATKLGNAGASSSVSPEIGPGRSIVQSAQLSLSAPASHIDDVAGEIFRVVGAAGGNVLSSTVTQTGGPDGFAQLELSLPSASLPQTMAQLSRLPDSTVVSRTDATSDITGAVDGTTRALGDARALRTGLLRRLAGASTGAELASLRGQLHDADAAIARLQRQLGRLEHSVAFSTVAVTITAAARHPVIHHHGGFGIGRGLRTAGRLLAAAAGGAVVAAAILLPLAGIGALIWWPAAWRRRRSRLEALRQV